MELELTVVPSIFLPHSKHKQQHQLPQSISWILDISFRSVGCNGTLWWLKDNRNVLYVFLFGFWCRSWINNMLYLYAWFLLLLNGDIKRWFTMRHSRFNKSNTYANNNLSYFRIPQFISFHTRFITKENTLNGSMLQFTILNMSISRTTKYSQI